MIGATLYIMRCTAKNRLLRRLRRLREPRYLIGAAVGFAYLFFAIYGRSRGRRFATRNGRGVAPASFLPVVGAAGPALAGLALLVAASVSWLMPFSSGLFDFTKAETAILFTAPISRRELLFYRLVRSQWAVFFGALVVALTYPLAGVSTRIRGLAALWIILMTCHVFFTGVTLARARLRTGTAASRRVAWAPLLLTAGAAVAVLAEVGIRVSQHSIATAGEAFHLIADVSLSGASHIVLLPFVALVRPLFAESFAQFVRVLPATLAIYAVTIAWVLRADDVFGEVAESLAETDQNRPATRTTAYQARAVGWTLALEGRPEMAFVWKAALQTFRIVDRRVLIRVAIVAASMIILVTVNSRARGLTQGLGLLMAVGGVFVVFFGPQMLRIDLRQDLQHLELLKTWPARSAAVVRGELIWPGIIISCIAWVFGAIAMVLSEAAFAEAGLALRIAGGIGAMILAPAVVFAQFTIHNAAALIFPAWIPLGGTRPRGVDAMGQRLIMVGATWLLLAVSLLPGLIAAGVLWFAFYRLVGPWVLIPAALACSMIVGLEVLIATEALGPAYERLDISSVERGE